jgi:hypothetical protein
MKHFPDLEDVLEEESPVTGPTLGAMGRLSQRIRIGQARGEGDPIRRARWREKASFYRLAHESFLRSEMELVHAAE